MLNIPQRINEVYNRIVADFKTYNKKAQPAVKNSWIGAILVAIAGRIYDIYRKLNFILKQAFIDTATGEYLKRWGKYVKIYQKAATKSSGNFIITGSEGAIVPIGTQILVDKIVYETKQSISLVQNEVVSATVKQEFDLVTITFENEHNLGTGMTVSISNKLYVVEVLDAFSISITESETMPSSVTVKWIGNIVACSPTTYGNNTNLAAGQTGKISVVLKNVDTICYTDFAGFTGGQDIESDDNLRARIIYRYQNPVTNFNKAAITTFVQSLSGVGDVKVYEITPDVGQVTIYYLLQNNEMPSAGHIELVRNSIDSDLRPANTDMEDIFTYSGIPIVVNVIVQDLRPLTLGIKNAVNASIKQFFASLKIGDKFYRNDLIEAIKQAVDTETGLQVISFTLDEAIVDIEMDIGQFAKLGDISL